MVSRGLAICRLRSDTAIPMVFVPTSRPMSGRPGGRRSASSSMEIGAASGMGLL
jgi:hypothetical protein